MNINGYFSKVNMSLDLDLNLKAINVSNRDGILLVGNVCEIIIFCIFVIGFLIHSGFLQKVGHLMNVREWG